jgi:hypothetical protein
MAKLGKGIKFIALRAGLRPNELPPLLQGQLSPEIDPAALDLQQVINGIHGVTKKPPLGLAPPGARTAASTASTGFSTAALAVARTLVERSEHATRMGPHSSVGDIAAAFDLSLDDVRDALHELGSLVKVSPGGDLVLANDDLFVTFDKHWMPWDPEADALQLATALVNDCGLTREPEALAKAFGWTARRLNPATAYLANHGHIKALKSHSPGTWLLAAMHDNDATRRFVKSRS